MASPREFYKSIHPDYFSDSVKDEVSELDRSLLEFHLDTLTSRSQEADFERFARRLCEKEICPNLVPSTGPTGGGDGKVDSETYPVADGLVMAWFDGLGRASSDERWGFAFSAKARWLPKVQSDVAKIADTGRGYKKVFFVTNQAVSSRKRAETQDGLTEKHGIGVTILDRTWILEKVFGSGHEQLAIDELGVTGLKKPRTRTGPGDTARNQELEEVQARIAEATADRRYSSKLVDDLLEAGDLRRSLERPRAEVEATYSQADQMALKHGTPRQAVESAYQWAWTLFWWYEDLSGVITQYEVVEARAKSSENAFDLERLHNLWTILSTRISRDGTPEEQAWMEERTSVLVASLTRLSGDTERPSVSLQSRTHLLMLRLWEDLVSAQDPSPIFNELTTVVESVEGLVGYPLEPLAQSLMVVGEVVEDNDAYNALLDKIVEVSSRRDGEMKAAGILLNRGEQLMTHGRYVKALAIIGQSLGRLYKHETRHQMVYALYLCGQAYERIGLVWAARGTYLTGASIAANDFWKHDKITAGFAACVDRLKWIELRIGRIPQLLSWHELDFTIRAHVGPPNDAQAVEDKDSQFDILVSRLMLRTPYSLLNNVRRLPSALDELGLFGASCAIQFLMGYSQPLSELIKDGMDVGEFASRIYGLESDVPLSESPTFGLGAQETVSTKILGCAVSAICSTERPCVEVAESVLATLESFLATIGLDKAMPHEPELAIEVRIEKTQAEMVTFSEYEQAGRPCLLLKCRPFDPYDLSLGERQEVTRQVFEVAVSAFAHTIWVNDFETSLSELLEIERVRDRASAFAGPLGTMENIQGNKPKLDLLDWKVGDDEGMPVLRVVPWKPTVFERAPEPQESKSKAGQAGPDAQFDPGNIPHGKMKFVSATRTRLWDQAGWHGVFFLTSEGGHQAPVLAIIFTDESVGREIFKGWREDYGLVDEHRGLRISIVRGIDTHNPHAYRVLVGVNLKDSERDGDMLLFQQRIKRMDATTPVNLRRFEESYRVHNRYALMPAFMNGGTPEPCFDLQIGMYEVNFRQAWEIGPDDLDCAAVQSDDEIIVPEGMRDVPGLVPRRRLRG